MESQVQTRIEVRPIEQEKWHGKKGAEAFGQPKVIEALYDDNTGGYATGLTEEEAEKYSKLLGGVDLSPIFITDKAHPFWSSKQAQIKLEHRTMIFHLSRAIDFVKVKVMKASKFVANSMKEYEEGKWPYATHVIYDESEEIDKKASKFELKEKVFALISKMTAEQKGNLIQILADKSTKGVSNNFISTEIEKLIESHPEELLKYGKMDKAEVGIRATILNGLMRNILTKEGQQVLYMGDVIADNFEDTVKYFQDPNNTKQKVAILEKINS